MKGWKQRAKSSLGKIGRKKRSHQREHHEEGTTEETSNDTAAVVTTKIRVEDSLHDDCKSEHSGLNSMAVLARGQSSDQSWGSKAQSIPSSDPSSVEETGELASCHDSTKVLATRIHNSAKDDDDETRESGQISTDQWTSNSSRASNCSYSRAEGCSDDSDYSTSTASSHSFATGSYYSYSDLCKPGFLERNFTCFPDADLVSPLGESSLEVVQEDEDLNAQHPLDRFCGCMDDAQSVQMPRERSTLSIQTPPKEKSVRTKKRSKGISERVSRLLDNVDEPARDASPREPGQVILLQHKPNVSAKANEQDATPFKILETMSKPERNETEENKQMDTGDDQGAVQDDERTHDSNSLLLPVGFNRSPEGTGDVYSSSSNDFWGSFRINEANAIHHYSRTSMENTCEEAKDSSSIMGGNHLKPGHYTDGTNVSNIDVLDMLNDLGALTAKGQMKVPPVEEAQPKNLQNEEQKDKLVARDIKKPFGFGIRQNARFRQFSIKLRRRKNKKVESSLLVGSESLDHRSDQASTVSSVWTEDDCKKCIRPDFVA